MLVPGVESFGTHSISSTFITLNKLADVSDRLSFRSSTNSYTLYALFHTRRETCVVICQETRVYANYQFIIAYLW